MNFREKVIEVVKNIPSGKVLTYKQVANLAGSPKAYRAVGNILRSNYNEGKIKIPCHRVIRTGGKFGNYAKGENSKKKLLNKEGIYEQEYKKSNL